MKKYKKIIFNNFNDFSTILKIYKKNCGRPILALGCNFKHLKHF